MSGRGHVTQFIWQQVCPASCWQNWLNTNIHLSQHQDVYCTVMYCNVLYCTVLYCTASRCLQYGGAFYCRGFQHFLNYPLGKMKIPFYILWQQYGEFGWTCIFATVKNDFCIGLIYQRHFCIYKHLSCDPTEQKKAVIILL